MTQGNFQNQSLIYKCTSDIRLRWFQFRFTHHILATNVLFFQKTGIKGTSICTFCNNEEETLLPLYYECKTIPRIWLLVEQWIYEKNWGYSIKLYLTRNYVWKIW